MSFFLVCCDHISWHRESTAVSQVSFLCQSFIPVNSDTSFVQVFLFSSNPPCVLTGPRNDGPMLWSTDVLMVYQRSNWLTQIALKSSHGLPSTQTSTELCVFSVLQRCYCLVNHLNVLKPKYNSFVSTVILGLFENPMVIVVMFLHRISGK